MLANHIQVNIGAAFDDQFIMDVPDDEAMPEGFHGIAEDVPTDGLHDILNELRTIGFDAFPFLCGSNTFISYGFAAELILTDTRLHVGEKATGGKLVVSRGHTREERGLLGAKGSREACFVGRGRAVK